MIVVNIYTCILAKICLICSFFQEARNHLLFSDFVYILILSVFINLIRCFT